MEFVVLSKRWLSGISSKRHAGFVSIINKAYAKPKIKYGIIKTDRIKADMSILDNFRINNDDDFCVLLLLGPQSVFEDISSEDGYLRSFESDNTTLEEANNCNIPDAYAERIGLTTLSNVSFTFYNYDEELTAKQMNRIIGSIGFKSYHGNFKNDPFIQEYEITCFTSFMKWAGPTMLELAITQYLKKQKDVADKTSKIILHADCIREHNLVHYYVSQCKFVSADKPDTYVDVHSASASGVFEDNLEANRDFHISYLYRIID